MNCIILQNTYSHASRESATFLNNKETLLKINGLLQTEPAMCKRDWLQVAFVAANH